jgi:hypothetical protein
LINLGRGGTSVKLGGPTTVPLEMCHPPDLCTRFAHRETYVEGTIQEWKSVEKSRVCEQRRDKMNLRRFLEIIRCHNDWG